jgi:hypothetical protein
MASFISCTKAEVKNTSEFADEKIFKIEKKYIVFSKNAYQIMNLEQERK